MIQILKRTTLHRKIGEIRCKGFSPRHGAVQDDNTRCTFGLQVLQEQATHPACTDHRHLLIFKREEVINTSALTEFQLGQLNGR